MERIEVEKREKNERKRAMGVETNKQNACFVLRQPPASVIASGNVLD
jgi:hypothetical protein